MHIDGVKFLVTVCEPLQLTLQCNIESETQGVLSLALHGQLELLHSRGFIPTMVCMNPQSAFRSLMTQYPGVVIDIGGAGYYVSKVDGKIRRIKELYRSMKSGLSGNYERPSGLPHGMIEHMVHYSTKQVHKS
jgi:hypothetical protein